MAQLRARTEPAGKPDKAEAKKGREKQKGAQGLMRDYVILTDSCCDLSAEMARRTGRRGPTAEPANG